MINEQQYATLTAWIDYLIDNKAHVNGNPLENVLTAVARVVEAYEDEHVPPLEDTASLEAFNRFIKSL